MTIGVHGPHLPPARTSLVGRGAELAQLSELVIGSGGRILSIVGGGGCGKTHLAVEVARRTAPSFRDGCAFVSLVDLHDPALVVTELIRVLGLSDVAGVAPIDQLIAGLRSLRMLIVLDGFEHLAPAAATLSEVATRSPDVRMLVTSRRRLRVAGERALPLGPLPDDAAVALFCERAAAVNPRFEPSGSVRQSAAEICRVVDRLPLAIELVASRVRLLPPDALLERLQRADDALAILEGGPADAPARHRTLRDTIQWSYDLLGADAARLLPRLAVFRAGWTVRAMEDVCCDGDLTVRQGSSALTELLGLHLVETVDTGDGEPRFRVPETVRRFAMEILRRAELAESMLDRHADYFIAVAIRAGQDFAGPHERSLAGLIDQDLPNIRAALQRHATLDHRGAGLAAAAALGPYWLDWGPLREGRDCLDGFLAAPGGTPGLRAVATGWSVRLAIEQGEVGDAREGLLRGRQVLDAGDSLPEWLRITDHLALALRLNGEYDRAEQYLVEALARCRSPDTAWLHAELLLSRAVAVRDRGDTSSAIDLLHRTIRVARRAKHERVVARAIVCRALIDPTMEHADVELERAFRLCRELGDLRGAAMSAAVAAVRAFVARDRPRAARWFLACLDSGVTVGYWPAVAWALMGVIGLSVRDGQLRNAARLHGALRPHLDVVGRQTPPDRMADYDRLVELVATRLGDDFVVERDDGEAGGWAAAVDLARRIAAEFAQTRTKHRRRGPRANSELTDRELEVLRELVVGRTNQHIAERLGLSPKTVMHHTGSLYRKLGVRGRTEAVAHALREQLVAG